ncbi:hypothetical protein LOK49_LG12G02265 [Camellia lanceoleosa]|uniref:Uncharacterized protein n=1 Tax=Camellia lanceoleosa TaxID=1840588 RepID=A0ACC0FRN6_9ERIC|nr:hypothetical protein LOK49_LG12G02265 [Camellia lanceoleosa]
MKKFLWFKQISNNVKLERRLSLGEYKRAVSWSKYLVSSGAEIKAEGEAENSVFFLTELDVQPDLTTVRTHVRTPARRGSALLNEGVLNGVLWDNRRKIV